MQRNQRRLLHRLSYRGVEIIDTMSINEGQTEKGVKVHLLKEFCSLPQNERIADSVEPILPDHLLLRHLRVERIRVDIRGYTSCMERRIEVCDVYGLW